MHLDMVRPGIMIYGMYSSEDVDKSRIDLKPAMTLKAKIIFVKDVEKDVCISYRRTFTTKRESKIATISIGYAEVVCSIGKRIPRVYLKDGKICSVLNCL